MGISDGVRSIAIREAVHKVGYGNRIRDTEVVVIA